MTIEDFCDKLEAFLQVNILPKDMAKGDLFFEYEWTDLMPDGTFTGAVPGEWICLDCSYCENCDGDLLQNECICEESKL